VGYVNYSFEERNGSMHELAISSCGPIHDHTKLPHRTCGPAQFGAWSCLLNGPNKFLYMRRWLIISAAVWLAQATYYTGCFWESGGSVLFSVLHGRVDKWRRFFLPFFLLLAGDRDGPPKNKVWYTYDTASELRSRYIRTSGAGDLFRYPSSREWWVDN
jgi:hypothetical protein